MSLNRRTFIRSAALAATGHFAGLRPFGAMNALAQGAFPDYKALVCIFLFGGNDANNTVIPLGSGDNGYANYASIRGSLALSASSLLPLGLGANGEFGLHPSLNNPTYGGLQSLFNSGKAAIVANVGTLVAPTTPASFQNQSVPVPNNLFSHPDQQLEWQNAEQNGAYPSGWAGRLADTWGSTYGTNPQIPLITSLAGDSLFCNGSLTSPVAVAPGNLSGASCSEGAACNVRNSAAQLLANFQSGFSLVQADMGITRNAYTYMKHMASAVQSAPVVNTPFPPANPLAAQLQQIAQIIAARSALGVQRQIFFASLGNFDTHANQLSIQSQLLSFVGPAMASFYAATEELGLANSVTSFTMSDFSRAFEPNSNYGTDHAWGSHHFVVGGAVAGGQIYGTFPTLALGGPNDSGTNGRWVPTTASFQYAAQLASWFGVTSAQLPILFPYLQPNIFPPPANLAFMG
ncbi:Oligopeptide ABC transporter, periplasmic oligopeptide-binding protein OppA [Acidisarcina polymorpha]|uniref:Oligopeptide ABC transporter, periplasmic oligopeptide-binding protein OppA n=1 Tax=Acidisarcina polymorpha TaxID=2211140 RepID=A0A2Z5G176_9BACT|nr:DUF1501 domain-containing protein [Acidisarcina polymorpha]AXC12923.1 Oligopeptide ABC transporter, periplasmic oligopeptide-binding protein OppA [Acidisarcina polymorpha]